MSEGSAVYQAITNVGPSAEATAVIPWWLHGVVILGALLQRRARFWLSFIPSRWCLLMMKSMELFTSMPVISPRAI